MAASSMAASSDYGDAFGPRITSWNRLLGILGSLD
jgi:hypothetical protein